MKLKTLATLAIIILTTLGFAAPTGEEPSLPGPPAPQQVEIIQPEGSMEQYFENLTIRADRWLDEVIMLAHKYQVIDGLYSIAWAILLLGIIWSGIRIAMYGAQENLINFGARIMIAAGGMAASPWLLGTLGHWYDDAYTWGMSQSQKESNEVSNQFKTLGSNTNQLSTEFITWIANASADGIVAGTATLVNGVSTSMSSSIEENIPDAIDRSVAYIASPLYIGYQFIMIVIGIAIAIAGISFPLIMAASVWPQVTISAWLGNWMEVVTTSFATMFILPIIYASALNLAVLQPLKNLNTQLEDLNNDVATFYIETSAGQTKEEMQQACNRALHEYEEQMETPILSPEADNINQIGASLSTGMCIPGVRHIVAFFWNRHTAVDADAAKLQGLASSMAMNGWVATIALFSAMGVLLVAERTISKIFGAFIGAGLAGVGASGAAIKSAKTAANAAKTAAKGAATVAAIAATGGLASPLVAGAGGTVGKVARGAAAIAKSRNKSSSDGSDGNSGGGSGGGPGGGSGGGPGGGPGGDSNNSPDPSNGRNEAPGSAAQTPLGKPQEKAQGQLTFQNGKLAKEKEYKPTFNNGTEGMENKMNENPELGQKMESLQQSFKTSSNTPSNTETKPDNTNEPSKE